MYGNALDSAIVHTLSEDRPFVFLQQFTRPQSQSDGFLFAGTLLAISHGQQRGMSF